MNPTITTSGPAFFKQIRFLVFGFVAILVLAVINGVWVLPANSSLRRLAYTKYKLAAHDAGSQISIFLRSHPNFNSQTDGLALSSFLQQSVLEAIKDDGGSIYVVDGDGYLVAHTNTDLVSQHTKVLPREMVSRALVGKEGSSLEKDLTYFNEKGEKTFAVALPAINGWAVVAEGSTVKVFALFRLILIAAGMSLGIEILLIILLLRNYMIASLFYSERNQRESILNSLYDGVIEYDSDSRIILMNPKAEELLGIRSGTVQNITVTADLAKERPELKGLVEVMFPALAPYASSTKELPGTNAKTMEIHVSDPELKLQVTLTQVTDQQGGVKGFLKILHDISRERLLARIKSEFVSIAAHQLRTPLSAIKWTLKLLIDGDVGDLSASQLEFLQKGYVINERMIKLVNDLLNAARIEEGRFGYEFKDLDLNDFFDNLYSTYIPLAQSKGVLLKFEQSTEKLPVIYADQEKLSLAISNILDNAIKYTPQKGSVTFRTEKKGGFVEIAISDTGAGIPKEEQKRVFSKFFRASNVLRMETEGTGLGLFIVRNIIKRHGGNTRFESVEGDGTTFYITLPVTRELVPKQETPMLEEFLETI